MNIRKLKYKYIMWSLLSAFFAISGHNINTSSASGFDNSGFNSIDLLFDPAKFTTEWSYTYVFRNVDYKAKNARTYEISAAGNLLNPSIIKDGAGEASALPDVANYMHRGKVAFTDEFHCMGRAYNPGTIHEEVPNDWNGRFSLVETNLQTFSLDATCGLKLPIFSRQYLWAYGGARYLHADLYVNKAIGIKIVDPPAISEVDVDISGHGYGWRAGLAYELPEYALRANLTYDSEIDIKATGTLETGELVINGAPFQFKGPSYAYLTMPQGVELNFQTGIAPGWLAFGGVKWVDWSVLDQLQVTAPNVIEGASTQYPLKSVRIFNFEDGWTVTAGLGHQLTDKIQIGSSFTWDKGIGGPYSDTYQLALGGSYEFNAHVKWSLGGAVVYKTAASDEITQTYSQFGEGYSSSTLGDDFKLNYDSSIQFALSTKLKLTF